MEIEQNIYRYRPQAFNFTFLKRDETTVVIRCHLLKYTSDAWPCSTVSWNRRNGSYFHNRCHILTQKDLDSLKWYA